eukprot:scaffold29808_cov129-Isochrysis_galbana.AAC.1
MEPDAAASTTWNHLLPPTQRGRVSPVWRCPQKLTVNTDWEKRCEDCLKGGNQGEMKGRDWEGTEKGREEGAG